VPYLTPQELPEGDVCRPLSIPDDSEWLALFGGALTELTKSWNWEYSGGLTVDETIEKIQEIIDIWYEGCQPCTYPGGIRIIRVGSNGRLEMLDDNGEWVEPTGDYIIPPPDAREGGTEQDQICLASKNAVNVIRILYEEWTEAWASELTLDEAIVAVIAALVAIPAFVLFAPIAAAIALGIAGFLEIMFELIETLTSDLWDEAFNDELTCLFQSCASNDAGVVTFDWNCLNDKINQRINEFSLTDEQLRLYGQLGYLFFFIGGTDGINLAGSTTEITDDDCSMCDDGWCIYFDFTTDDYGWTVYSGVGSYVPGVGFQSHDYGTESDLLIQIPLGVTTSLRSSYACYTSTINSAGRLGYQPSPGTFTPFTLPQGMITALTPTEVTVMPVTTTVDVNNIYFNQGGSGGATFVLSKLWIFGDFDPKPEIGDECPEVDCG